MSYWLENECVTFKWPNFTQNTPWLLGRYNSKPSASRAECPNSKPRQGSVSFFATCFFFSFVFLKFYFFNFFVINISVSELPLITVSLFIRIDDLVHVVFVYSPRRFPVSGLDERYHLHVEMQDLRSVCVKGFKPIQLVQKLE